MTVENDAEVGLGNEGGVRTACKALMLAQHAFSLTALHKMVAQSGCNSDRQKAMMVLCCKRIGSL